MSHTNWCSLVLTSGDGRVREACDCGAIDDPQRDLAKRLADDAHTRTKPCECGCCLEHHNCLSDEAECLNTRCPSNCTGYKEAA
jgi:hypothetical protein